MLPAIAPSSAKETVDVSGELMLPGFVDTHAHVFQYVIGRFGLRAPGLPESGANGADPDTILEQVVPLLKPGDIHAHPFTRHPGGFVNRDGEVHPAVKEALARGLKTGVGHGSHFSATTRAFRRRAERRASIPTRTTCSSARRASRSSRRWARCSRAREGGADGTTNPAKMIGMESELGTLEPGVVADASVLHDERGRWTLRDNEGTKVQTDRMLQPFFCLRDGAAPGWP